MGKWPNIHGQLYVFQVVFFPGKKNEAVSLDLVEAFDRWRISGSRGGDQSPRVG